MPDTAAYRADEAEPFIDPTTGSGDIWIFPDGLGQKGTPYVMRVADPPNKTRSAHHHEGDVIYFYVDGEHHIEGEGTYRAGDVRWTRGGHVYGPETTGPEGGTWWLVSYADPLPIEGPPVRESTPVVSHEEARQLVRFTRPYDWDAIHQTIADDGAVVAEGLFDDALVARLNDEFDAWIADPPVELLPHTGSPIYDVFLGKRTLRLHGLPAKFPSAADAVAHPEIVTWVARSLDPVAASVLLNAGELIQIGPGEPAQLLHRDTASWPLVERSDDPVLVNAMIALSPFTAETGATVLALGSHQWPPKQRANESDLGQAEMQPGDVLLLRGDVLHGGGANRSDTHRRGLSLSYCAGWLRPVENGTLNVPPDVAKNLPPVVQALLGYAMHDATDRRGGVVGLYEGGDPALALRETATEAE